MRYLLQEELRRLEMKTSSSTEWSEMFLHSKENKLLFDTLRRGFGFKALRERHPDFLAEAPDRISLAAVEWKSFADEKYLNKGFSVPDHPKFVEIQEVLGLYGQTKWERKFRRMKRKAQKHVYVFFDWFKTWCGQHFGKKAR